MDQGGVRGKLCLYHHPDLRFRNEPLLLIGNFSCAHDHEVAHALFTAAESEADALQLPYLAGPLNGNVWNDYRLPISGNEPLFTGDLTQPLYYANLFCSHGFTTIHRYHSYVSVIPEIGPDTIVFPEGIAVTKIDKAKFKDDLAGLYALTNRAFVNNPFFTPAGAEQFIDKYMQVLPLVDERLTWIARKQGDPVAFLFSYRDPQHPETLVIKTAAKDPGHHLPGLMTNMARLLFLNAAEMGFSRAIHAFMHEENRSLLRSRDFGGSILRSYALLGKKL